jgi:hypothetical protein
MEAVINDYISREFVQDASMLPLGKATSLLETGILDALGLLRLVVPGAVRHHGGRRRSPPQ